MNLITPAKALRKGQRVLTRTNASGKVLRAWTEVGGLNVREVDWTEPIRVGGKGWTLVHFVDGTSARTPAGADWLLA